MQIIIADDHEIFRDGLKLLLGSRPDYDIVSEAENAMDLKEQVQRLQPDLVIMDYHMPGDNSLAVLDYIKKRYPKLKVVLLTGTQSGASLRQLAESRADAVLLKEGSGKAMISTLDQVMAGKRVIHQSVSDRIASVDFSLTQREFQILTLLVLGKPSSSIAEALGVSARTVDKHRENIMKKMDAKNVVQLVQIAYQLNLVEA
ncbi:MAG: response regulator transcription factor [Gammaproteobacteria bacterium]|nr:response regulator transcription factor [Gammaproteobacteria bacterium]MBU2057250.1 response regulator transcription factor [Gammaproteobacteria bacterium]MBU2174852.1 response regulator transcription factor [Gammaproteobacteria bacterium]MBU2245457.1 response regulator transcription factor [Gammaproteobacteria bacterium]MBU2344237.1 response regulator transcription factor [Gammaproteobacteria bacterium]